jgi:hypothetical protein
MHGPSFEGNGAAALSALADEYDRRASRRWLETGLSLQAA